MELIQTLGLLVSGFVILIIGGEALVHGAISLAARLKLTPAIIGLTIVAAGTSAPEFVTCLIAAIKETPDIAVGNVIGSNIFNILAIVGGASLIKPNIINKNFAKFELNLLIIVSVIFVMALQNFYLSRTEGTGALILLFAIFWISVARARKVGYEANDNIKVSKHIALDIFFLAVGIAALIGGAELALKGGIELGRLFGLSERIIGLTIISVGTGLPELATSVVASYRGRHDMAIANVVGSNILNTLGVAGMTASIKPIKVNEQMAHMDGAWMLGATLLMVALVWVGRHKIHRMTGFFLVLLYSLYIYSLI